eukprot:UN06365
MSWKTSHFWPWDLDDNNVLLGAISREQCGKERQRRLKCFEKHINDDNLAEKCYTT